MKEQKSDIRQKEIEEMKIKEEVLDLVPTLQQEKNRKFDINWLVFIGFFSTVCIVTIIGIFFFSSQVLAILLPAMFSGLYASLKRHDAFSEEDVTLEYGVGLIVHFSWTAFFGSLAYYYGWYYWEWYAATAIFLIVTSMYIRQIIHKIDELSS
jgi:hypothetical protein